jgi:hypothetical protein
MSHNYLHDRDKAIRIRSHASKNIVELASFVGFGCRIRVNVLEERQVNDVNCERLCLFELRHSIVEEFGHGKSAYVPWISAVVGIFWIPANSKSFSGRNTVIDWIYLAETIDYYLQRGQGIAIARLEICTTP